MSHILGDGNTYYQLLNCVISDTSPPALIVEAKNIKYQIEDDRFADKIMSVIS